MHQQTKAGNVFVLIRFKPFLRCSRIQSKADCTSSSRVKDRRTGMLLRMSIPSVISFIKIQRAACLESTTGNNQIACPCAHICTATGDAWDCQQALRGNAGCQQRARPCGFAACPEARRVQAGTVSFGFGSPFKRSAPCGFQVGSRVNCGQHSIQSCNFVLLLLFCACHSVRIERLRRLGVNRNLELFFCNAFNFAFRLMKFPFVRSRNRSNSCSSSRTRNLSIRISSCRAEFSMGEVSTSRRISAASSS